MAIRDDFFTALAKGAKWDVGVSINRTNPLPLDQYSVFQTEEKLNEYIAGAFSYPGQIIALVDENATTIYYLDQNKEKQPVGIIPTGDGKTIEVTATGAISLLGGVDAANGTLPMIGEDGKLTWKTLEQIGAGDGNDNTTYEFTLGEDGKSFSIKTLFNGQPIKGEDGVELDPQVITFDVYTKSEVDAKIGTASTEEAEATGVYVAIEAEAERAAAAEKALGERVDGVNTALADYAKTADVNTELAKKADKSAYDQTVLDLDALEAKVDAFLTGTGTEAALDSLQELIAYIDEHDGADLTELFATVQGIEGKLEGIDSTVVAYVTAAIDALKIGDYAKASDLADLAAKVDVEKVSTAIATAKQEAIDDAATKYATTGALEGVSNRVGELEKIDHTVYATKTELKATDDVAKDAQSRVGIVEGKIDEITSVGGEPNVIERIKVNDVTQTVTNKEVNITVPTKTSDLTDDKFGTLIEAAQAQADKGVADAKTAKDAADAADGKAAANATAITGLDTRLTAAEGVGNTNTGAIAGHETRLAAAEATIKTINETSLPAKADKSVVDGLSTTVGTHTQEIAALGTNKADASAVYTKEQVYTKTEIDGITGTIPADSNLMAEIAKAQAAATYDDTKVKEDISKNATAIENITKEGGAIDVAKQAALDAVNTLKTTEVAANTKAIADEVTRATGVEADFETRIAEIENFFSAADNKDETIENLAEIIAYIESDKTGALDMAGDIEANANAIKAINETTIPAAIQTAKDYADAQITALDLANTYEAKGAAAGALTEAKGYTDAQITALGMANYKVKEVISGHDALTVSTDEAGKVTIGFASEIILNGGAATIA